MNVAPDFPLPGFRVAGKPPRGSLVVRGAAREDVRARWSGTEAEAAWRTELSGASFTTEVGEQGDHLFSHAESDLFWLSPDAGELLCFPAHPEGFAWRRVLLDTVLFSVALARGGHALHASAVAFDHGVVALMGRTGAGKTSLALELIGRGARFFSDDVLFLERRDLVTAFPGPPVANVPVGASRPPDLGSVISEFKDQGEDWVHVDGTRDVPLPLAGVCLLDRAAEGLKVRRVPAGLRELLPYVIAYSHLGEGGGERFELLGQIAEDVPVFEVSAHRTDSTAMIARSVEHAVLEGDV